jgi:hypothetical protein
MQFGAWNLWNNESLVMAVGNEQHYGSTNAYIMKLLFNRRLILYQQVLFNGGAKTCMN